MKKSIATIALFTLALVTTSFTTMETSADLSNTVSMDPPTGGQNSGGVGSGTRKQDTYTFNHASNDNIQLGSFGSDSQSAINNVKLD